MLAEGGWTVTDFRGEPFAWTGKIEYRHPGVIAAPAELHGRLLTALQA